ncbi:hypothetical protein [Tannerella sp.]|uniref:hypothetical protein n=1 Tax=Tannerella sp. TaxID=2382127 RepID=UPI0026DCE70F|nr:hypothetical protein [Tannerella sp.]MDO4702827.1 hypothetical protein [Tannerella sp.]
MSWLDIINLIVSNRNTQKLLTKAATGLMQPENMKCVVKGGAAVLGVLGAVSVGAVGSVGVALIVEKIKIKRLNRKTLEENAKKQFERYCGEKIKESFEKGKFSKVDIGLKKSTIHRDTQGRTYLSLMEGKKTLACNELEYESIDIELDNLLNKNINKYLIV